MHVSDYQTVKGVSIPHQMTVSSEAQGQEEWTMNASIKLNPPLTPERFERATEEVSPPGRPYAPSLRDRGRRHRLLDAPGSRPMLSHQTAPCASAWWTTSGGVIIGGQVVIAQGGRQPVDGDDRSRVVKSQSTG